MLHTCSTTTPCLTLEEHCHSSMLKTVAYQASGPCTLFFGFFYTPYLIRYHIASSWISWGSRLKPYKGVTHLPRRLCATFPHKFSQYKSFAKPANSLQKYESEDHQWFAKMDCCSNLRPEIKRCGGGRFEIQWWDFINMKLLIFESAAQCVGILDWQILLPRWWQLPLRLTLCYVDLTCCRDVDKFP